MTKQNEALDQDVKQLSAIMTLANRQLELEREIAADTEQLNIKIKALRVINQDILPEALENAGLTELTMKSGHVVRLSTNYTCSLSGKYRESALSWLKEHGLDDIVSHDIIETFGPQDTKQLQRLRNILSRGGFNFLERENVNTSTFKALVRERIEAGEPIPLDEIGVIAIRQTKIEPPPKKRSSRIQSR